MTIFRNGKAIKLAKIECQLIYAELQREYLDSVIIRRLEDKRIKLPKDCIYTICAHVLSRIQGNKDAEEIFYRCLDSEIECEIKRMEGKELLFSGELR